MIVWFLSHCFLASCIECIAPLHILNMVRQLRHGMLVFHLALRAIECTLMRKRNILASCFLLYVFPQTDSYVGVLAVLVEGRWTRVTTANMWEASFELKNKCLLNTNAQKHEKTNVFSTTGAVSH